mmetsp:Transcript_68910/g.217891  ORF Transcript_68910/g.217891 Transcript_68910/m.217891 type:complete len:201 (+) Transcript_68910:2-604(+)
MHPLIHACMRMGKLGKSRAPKALLPWHAQPTSSSGFGRPGLLQERRDLAPVRVDVGLDDAPAVRRAHDLLHGQVLGELHAGNVARRVPVHVGQVQVSAQRHQRLHGFGVGIAGGLHEGRHASVVHLEVHVEAVLPHEVCGCVALLEAKCVVQGVGTRRGAASGLQLARIVAGAAHGVEEKRATLLVEAIQRLAEHLWQQV